VHPQLQLPENAVRGVEPIRLINQLGQIINIVEQSDDQGVEEGSEASSGENSDMKLESDDNEETVTPVPMMSRDGRLMYLIR
jgi:hypothetical protein